MLWAQTATLAKIAVPLRMQRAKEKLPKRFFGVVC